ncbi:MAG: hypothetical protein KatS3mg115_2523 [Candidatus Poribacteria bacterium]|nr:MAG: hypothetical protein KatS3mg115_2523 [Candidatus Poribacteria bacterium]
MRRIRWLGALGVLLWLTGALWTLAQRPIEVTPEMLRRVLEDFEVGDNWIYNDLERAEQRARETGKPLFVLFRCVPCEACKAFDQEVLRADQELRELLAQYVPVRIVRMNQVDLGRFQYDYDLSWAAFLMNADGTVYGRYGIRAGHDSESHISVASLKRALRRGLELHREYPQNRHLFAGKEARPVRFRFAEEMFPLQRAIQEEDLRKGCVHCHMIKEAQIQIAQREGTWSKEKIWEFLVWPLPENVGMVMEVDLGNVIRAVLPGSFAERAGLQPGR